MNAKNLINHYGLKPHPEGGFYVQSYKSTNLLRDPDWSGHVYSTAILFLLEEGSLSQLHRIAQDEVWHFYLGDPLELAILHLDGREERVFLGQQVLNGEELQFVVPAGAWFGAKTRGIFSLVGCTVAPGFEFSDFELGKREELLKNYPRSEALINEFIPPER